MKIISVHGWKIFIQIVCKSVDFMSKPFKKQDEIQGSQLQIILNKGRPRPTYYQNSVVYIPKIHAYLM